ncbi:MAG: N-acetylmuramoyl-L-alanine amidase [Oscillospiraceae bacterium]|nr:N-acetylmuramoyl-L-alanine amidase [Oscillospiraceae bacterium]
MAKKKKKPVRAKRPANGSAQEKKPFKLNWWIIAAAVVLLAAIVTGVIILCAQQGDDNQSGNQSISPSVDPSGATTMRVVKPGTAYLTPDLNSGTVFSFRKGDQVKVVSIDGEWATIAVEGRGYYVPSNMLRGLDEYLIVVDAGHQLREDRGKEAIGPGGAETSIKMEVGFIGAYTGQQEYDVTLAVSKKLKDVLEARGYKVVMIRNHNAVTVSNMERAQVANKLYADAYISLHAASNADSSVRGIGAVSMSEKNSYYSEMYAENKELCDVLVDAMSKATGAEKLERRETDENSGINWCQVPMALLEMGHLSNDAEDRLLSSDSYRQKLAEGIANGLDAFFAEEEEK